jgi:S1-C subfamily serine protease
MSGKSVALEGYRLRAPVRHGNSGGPVVLPTGQVVGVIASGDGRNVGYAVAASEVIPLLQRAAATRAVDTGTC